jgi:RNA polymerase sigma-70 factor (ECF subfamily)
MNVRRRDAAQKRPTVRAAGDPDSLESNVSTPEREALRASLAPVVRELLATLPEPLAEALALHAVLGYTAGEIAEAADVPLETVRSRLRLARQALRKRALGDAILREALEKE